MTSEFFRIDDFLEQERQELVNQELWRSLREVQSAQSSRIIIDGKPYLNFSSNDYLGLANHPKVMQAAIEAIQKYGFGAGASRLICGSFKPHHELELEICDFKQTEAALSFSSGCATAVGTICSLLNKDDAIVLDRLSHACLIDAARMSGAKLCVFKHNDLSNLESILKRLRKSADSKRKILIVTESVFSMDGDIAPLKDIVELKEKYGAWLMVDEAHATGLFGVNRAGLIEELDLRERVEIQMGTLGKAIGSAGGFICGKKSLVEYLINRARSFVYSTAPPPCVAAAAKAGIEIIRSEEGKQRTATLWNLVNEFKQSLSEMDIDLSNVNSAIIPIILGSNERTLKASQFLSENGFFIPAIRFPTVPKNTARLRITISANHTPEDIRLLSLALKAALN